MRRELRSDRRWFRVTNAGKGMSFFFRIGIASEDVIMRYEFCVQYCVTM